MRTRIELQAKLEEFLGSRNVYFQPPATVMMQYPAIVYTRSEIRSRHADNVGYIRHYRYDITVIDKKIDNPAIEKLLDLPSAQFNRHYTIDNLNHDTISLYL